MKSMTENVNMLSSSSRTGDVEESWKREDVTAIEEGWVQNSHDVVEMIYIFGRMICG